MYLSRILNFEETDDDNQAELACNTLKGKGIRLHDRSAGDTMSYTLSMLYNVLWHYSPSKQGTGVCCPT